jgi:rSAM/selenodomain-associated transferase 1
MHLRRCITVGDKNLLGLLVKFPEPGRVKTRIAKDSGRMYAAAAYKRIAEKVFQNTVAEAGEFERIIFYAPANRGREFMSWIPGGRVVPQRGRGIGERMANALKELFSRGASKAIIAGVDIPELGVHVIKDALRKLDAADIVLGPAADGGYYLIGMKSLHEELFRNISWSTERVFRQTVSVADAIKLRYETVITLSDVDTIEDLKRFEGAK